MFQYLFIFFSLHFFYTTLIRHSVFMSLETCNFFLCFLLALFFPSVKKRRINKKKVKKSLISFKTAMKENLILHK